MDGQEREHAIYRITIVGAVVNLSLIIFKFLAAWLGRSSAMAADAVHSLSDLATDVIVLYFVHVANKPSDKGHDYGHGKYETFATMLIGLLLAVVAAGLFWNGVSDVLCVLRGERLAAPGYIALIAAFISIVSKEIVFHVTMRVGRKWNSDTVKANAWHHRSDAWSSIGTAVGIGGAVWMGEGWRILDPLAAIVVSVLIMYSSVRLFLPGFNDLMECSLPESVEDEILSIVNSCDGVRSPHNLRTRRIGTAYAIEVHVRMDGNLSLNEAHARATQIEKRLRGRFGPTTHVAIHVEPYK